VLTILPKIPEKYIRQQLSANICANYSTKNPTNTFNLNFNLPALPFSVEELLVWWQKEHLLIKTGTTYTKGFLPQQANEKTDGNVGSPRTENYNGCVGNLHTPLQSDQLHSGIHLLLFALLLRLV